MANSASSVRSRSRRAARKAPPRGPKRYGCEKPRVFTPPLRKLEPRSATTEKHTLGYSVIDFAEEVLMLQLLPWQKWLLVHMLELLPDNSLRFRTVIVLVARQNGKSTLSQVIALWFMYIYGVRLVLGTAQDLDTAEEVWQGAVDLVQELDDEDQPIRPELHDLLEKVVQVNGKKAMVLNSGERYKVKAANRRAGRGLSGDVILLDELREHQSWDAWGAITKTTMARAMALILALSNAGDASSIVLRYLRKMAHAALGDPDGINAEEDASALLPEEDELDAIDDLEDVVIEEDDDTLAIFEWSAPSGCSIHDRDGWAQANPSMGYTISERTIASAARTDPEWIFRTEVLCQWSDGSLEGPFPPGTWEAGRDPESRVARGNPIALCVDVSWDRSTAHVGLAGLREDGVPMVGIIASRAGTEWVLPWLQSDQAPPHTGVVIQSKGSPSSTLVDPLRDAGINVVEWDGNDLVVATGAFYDAVRAIDADGNQGQTLMHRPQPLLDLAAATAVPKVVGNGGFVWDRRKSPHDAAPLVAVTGALWGLAAIEEPARSAYEDSDLLLI